MEMKVPYYIVRTTAIHKDLTKVTEFKEQDLDSARLDFTRKCNFKVFADFIGIIELLKVEYDRENQQGLVLIERLESSGLDENKNHVIRYKRY